MIEVTKALKITAVGGVIAITNVNYFFQHKRQKTLNADIPEAFDSRQISKGCVSGNPPVGEGLVGAVPLSYFCNP